MYTLYPIPSSELGKKYTSSVLQIIILKNKNYLIRNRWYPLKGDINLLK